MVYPRVYGRETGRKAGRHRGVYGRYAARCRTCTTLSAQSKPPSPAHGLPCLRRAGILFPHRDTLSAQSRHPLSAHAPPCLRRAYRFPLMHHPVCAEESPTVQGSPVCAEESPTVQGHPLCAEVHLPAQGRPLCAEVHHPCMRDTHSAQRCTHPWERGGILCAEVHPPVERGEYSAQKCTHPWRERSTLRRGAPSGRLEVYLLYIHLRHARVYPAVYTPWGRRQVPPCMITHTRFTGRLAQDRRAEGQNCSKRSKRAESSRKLQESGLFLAGNLSRCPSEGPPAACFVINLPFCQKVPRMSRKLKTP